MTHLRFCIPLAALVAGCPCPAAAEPAAQKPAGDGKASVVVPLPPEAPLPAGLPSALPKGRGQYFPLAAAQARAQGLPPEIADAVIRVESGYDPGVVGGVGERGLMQVLPSTATMLGFTGTPEQLADPETNIRLGVRYLAGAWKLSGGDLCRTLMKYRAGHNETRMSPLSVEYCRRAKNHLAALGSPLGSGPLPAVDFVPAQAGAVAGTGVRTVRIAGRLRRVVSRRVALRGAKFWAAHEARIKAIEARLPWRRGGIMAGG